MDKKGKITEMTDDTTKEYNYYNESFPKMNYPKMSLISREKCTSMTNLIQISQQRKGYKSKNLDHDKLSKAVGTFRDKSNQIQKCNEKNYEGDDVRNS